MRAELASRLAALLRLSAANAFSHGLSCKICGGPAPFFDLVDFNKCALGNPYEFGPSGIGVPYFRCLSCGYIGTSFFDDWSADEFGRHIYNDDYQLIDRDYMFSRPMWMAGLVPPLLADFPNARLLDYGAGACVFSEAMRQRGFDVENYDPVTSPARPSGSFDIVMCVEVLEHSPMPIATLLDMQSFLSPDGCILFTQDLQPPDICNIRCNWWYAAPRNGHVSLYSDFTLATLAGRVGLVYFHGHPLHAFCDPAGVKARTLASRVGTPLFCPELAAPAGAEAAGWHGIEGPPTCRFRWSGTDKIEWKTVIPPGLHTVVRARVPFLMEVREGFAAECRITIGGRAADVTIRDATLVAEAGPFEPGEITITLQTPAPLVPDPSHQDGRALGLAVRVGTSEPARA